MALSEADIEAFIEALQQDPQLRDRVRSAILADDFLALPGIVRDLGEKLDRLTANVAQLTSDVAALVQRMDAVEGRLERVEGRLERVEGRLERVEGRLGNVEGRQFETNYVLNLPSRLGKHFRSARAVILPDVEEVTKALESGTLTEPEWDDLLLLDALAHGIERRTGERVYIALELSIVIDPEDISRASRRASTLSRLGLAVRACVDGESVLPEAADLADKLGVIILARKAA